MENTKKKSFAIGYSFILHSFLSYMFLAFVLVAVSNNVLPSFFHLIPDSLAQSMGGADRAMLFINTICAIISAVAAIFIGQWVDRKGAKQVLIAGCATLGFEFVEMRVCPLDSLFFSA